MPTFNAYNVILENATEEEALDYARGFVFSECELEQQEIGYYEHVDTVNGIDVWYDYGADYYFFTDADE